MPSHTDAQQELVASQLTSIRAALCTRMDGVVAQSMRESGLDYRYNWGWTRSHLVELATQYSPSRPLAEALRESSVRELQILSTMLFPHNELTERDIVAFLEKASNIELQEQLAFNLFAQVSLAVAWAERVALSNDLSEGEHYVALLTLANHAKRDRVWTTTISAQALEEYAYEESHALHCRRVAYDLLIIMEDRLLQ